MKLIAQKLFDFFFEEADNFILWLIASFASGTAFYFHLSYEPGKYIWLAFALFFIFLSFCFRSKMLLRFLCLLSFCFSIAIVNASFRTELLSSSKLKVPLEDVRIEGELLKVINVEKAKRLLLRLHKVKSQAVDSLSLPNIVQVTTRQAKEDLKIGQIVSMWATLHPPSQVLFPNKYDFSRHAYFNKIDANGFSISKVRVLKDSEHQTFSSALENLRMSIYNRLHMSLKGKDADVAAALMIGEQSAVSGDILEDMRRSGLSHVLSVSGVHLSLVSIICFFVFRLVLSNFVFFAHRYNIKKIAAVFSLFLTLFYLLISGLQIATIRSFIMVAFIILAVIFDRENEARRSVCFSAFLILLFMPESIFHPSFQMSFSAVLGLVSFYEIYIAKFANKFHGESNIFSKVKKYIYAAVVSSLIAGFSTAMFVLYNFNNYSHYSVLANLIVAPVVSCFVMPGVVLAFILMPFGAEKLGLLILDLGIRIMLKIANYVGSFSGAVSFLPSIPTYIVLIFVFGFFWVTLWQKSWRYLGVIPMLASLILLFTLKFPSLILESKYRSILVKDGNNLIKIGGHKRHSNWHENQWFSLTDTTKITYLKLLEDKYHFSKDGYDIRISVDLSKKSMGRVQDVSIIDSQGKAFVITQEDLVKNGSYFIYLNNNSIRYEKAIQETHRAWS